MCTTDVLEAAFRAMGLTDRICATVRLGDFNVSLKKGCSIWSFLLLPNDYSRVDRSSKIWTICVTAAQACPSMLIPRSGRDCGEL
jgi:hypothetical protein